MSYGGDTWAFSYYQSGRFTRGPTNVLAALFRRLITARGTLRGGDEEAAYGLDVAELIGSVEADVAAKVLPSQVAAELRKDERVSNVTVTATIVEAPSKLTTFQLDIAVDLEDEDESFSFSVLADEVGVELIGSVPT